MDTYGYMKDSELNLAEEIRQKYQISDTDMYCLVAHLALATHIERAQGSAPQFVVLRHVQSKYQLTRKHYQQLVSNLSTLCWFPHRAVVDAVGADSTYGTHPVHESIIFKALQEYRLLPPGRPAYKRHRAILRAALANVLKETNTKKRKTF